MPNVKGFNDNIMSCRFSEGIVRAGTMIPYAGGTIPAGWILCDGNALLQSAYPALYAAIGQRWGNGSQKMSGATVISSGLANAFNVPDGRGREPRGIGLTSGQDPDVASRTALLAGGLTGNNVGTYQMDATQRVTGRVGRVNSFAWRNEASGAFTNTLVGGFNGMGSGSGDASYYIDYDNAIQARTSTENRNKNFAVQWLIKI